MLHPVVLIAGDGIGPEVSLAARRVLDAALEGTGSSIEWAEHTAGIAAIEAGEEDVLPESTLGAIGESRVALKGPCTTPIGGGFSSVNVALRKALSLYAAVRPVRSMAGVATRYDNVDLVVVRENTEGLYSGIENEVTPGVVTSLKVATELATRRIARFAFEYCRKRNRSKLTVLHKANIMKLTDGLFLKSSREVHEDGYSDIEYEELIIDAGAMLLVQEPSRFDILLCENLYGDVMSDLCAGFVGGLGVTPGSNIGLEHAVFEAVHGSAPDIAGQNIANPLALIMSGVMMLNHLAHTRDDEGALAAASKIKTAYNHVLAAGIATADLGGSASTTDFTAALIDRIAGAEG